MKIIDFLKPTWKKLGLFVVLLILLPFPYLFPQQGFCAQMVGACKPGANVGLFVGFPLPRIFMSEAFSVVIFDGKIYQDSSFATFVFCPFDMINNTEIFEACGINNVLWVLHLLLSYIIPCIVLWMTQKNK